jgi:predicted GH43/DUF377 family glycosyl hydrolase
VIGRGVVGKLVARAPGNGAHGPDLAPGTRRSATDVMPTPLFVRHPANPIVRPGPPDWRLAVTFNPAVIHAHGRWWMLERTAGGLRPFICQLGLQTSEDGVRWSLARPDPVFTPADCGSPWGSVQDPRLVELDGRFWMTFAYRPYAWSSHPTAVGVPESHETEFPGVERAPVDVSGRGSANVAGGRPDNFTRSGLAVSDDLIHWRLHGWITDPALDDRNVILFPEKIGGRYAVLRRPLHRGGGSHLWISFSTDLATWSEPELVARAEFPWESNRIGGSTPPIRTAHGWLVFYHGVEDERPELRRVIYRMGAMLLDLEDPRRVLARSPEPLFQPEAYYEQVGAYIPNVVFPTAAVVRAGTIHLYYGACDTCIGLATASLEAVVAAVRQHPRG